MYLFSLFHLLNICYGKKGGNVGPLPVVGTAIPKSPSQQMMGADGSGTPTIFGGLHFPILDSTKRLQGLESSCLWRTLTSVFMTGNKCYMNWERTEFTTNFLVYCKKNGVH